MSKTRWVAARGAALLLPLLLGLTGCVTLEVRYQPDEEAAPAPSEPAGKQELPPEKQAEVCWAAAEELRQRGFEREALAQYERVAQVAPARPGLAWRLALLYGRLGDVARARVEYGRALAADPRNPDLLTDRGYFHYRLGEYPEAERWLRQALGVAPGHQRAMTNFALTLCQQGRVEDGLECFSRVVSRAQAHCNVAVVLAKREKHAEARKHLREAVRLDPSLGKAQQLLTWLDQHETRKQGTVTQASGVQ